MNPKLIPRIETSPERKLVGKRLIMSFADYKVADLWKSFMPGRQEISNALTTDLISMAVYKATHFTNFMPTNTFEKWAAVQVEDFVDFPSEMESYVLESGLYAVFEYKGLNTDSTIYNYIFGSWLPQSGLSSKT